MTNLMMMKFMNNSSEDNFIRLPKDVLVLNTLAMGVAIQILAKLTEETTEAWKDYIGAKAREQYDQLPAKQMQEIVDELKSL